MNVTMWAQQDQGWVSRYRTSMTGKHVPALALQERESELLDAVREAGVPAAELFGDANALATEDAVELATPDEAVRMSLGGGLRRALREVGGTLSGLAAVSLLSILFRGGWSVDVPITSALIAVSLTVGYTGWVVSRALFSGGRPIATSGVLAAAGAVAVAGIAWAARLNADDVVARDVSVPLMGLGMLAPGVLVLVAASRLPQPTLREDWDDAEWLRRFRSGLRTRLVPSATTRGHVDEVHQTIKAGTASAFEEFGHPLVLARQLSEADRTGRTRRWWVSVIAGTGTPLAAAALTQTNDSWGAVTRPLVVIFVLLAVVSLLVRWRDRPWRTR